MIKKHQTPSYIYSRIKQILYIRKNREVPWMNKNAVNILNQLINKSDVGLEFGSGRSTRWFAERCFQLTSIEHNKDWYDIVSRQIIHLNNINYRLLSLNVKPQESEYYKSLLEFDDKSLDFLINDGKYRDLIAAEGVKKIKSGGIYILDNAERYIKNNFNLPEPMVSDWNTSLHWKFFNEFTNGWRKIWTTDGVSSTLILIRTN